MKKISWAICDDVNYLCETFKLALENCNELEYKWSANGSQQCMEQLASCCPDILLLDIQMETEKAGIELIPRIKEEFPKVKIIILTSYDDENYIFMAFANGADDYVLKTTGNDEIARSIINVYNNTSMLRPEIARKISRRSMEIETQQKSLLFVIEIMSKLSTSEFEILKAVYQGDSYKKIAEDRFVDISTVYTHASRILKKFEHSNMQQLVKELKKLKVLDLFQK